MNALSTLFPVFFMIILGMIARIKGFISPEQKEGANHIAVRLGRHSADSCFNIHFLEDEQAALGLLSFPQHIVDFEYIKP